MKARDRNPVMVGCVYRDLDRRYSGRAADRRVEVQAIVMSDQAVVRSWIGRRESRKSVLAIKRLADPGRFLLVQRPASPEMQAISDRAAEDMDAELRSDLRES